MRLWPISILNKLPRQQLLGQHRECCALRGMGWGRKHAKVDYVFEHPYFWLFKYHLEVIYEMDRRGYKINPKWGYYKYRGSKIGCDETDFPKPTNIEDFKTIYPEHNKSYLCECIENLKLKGVILHGID